MAPEAMMPGCMPPSDWTINMTNDMPMRSYASLFAFCLVSVVFLPRLAFALPPANPAQIAGEVSSFAPTAKELHITASDGAILHHLSFDVAADETVRFIQPGTDARVLNRIIGAGPSQIDGQLLGNGHVYIVNSAGVTFGSGSIVEVGKLHAIAGVLADQDFLDGLNRYSFLTGEIQNQGSITAGEVVLAGSTLSNSGRIIAPEGLVVLAAGSGLEVASANDSITVSLQSPSPGSENAGALLSVGDLAGQALWHSGVVEASRLEIHASTMVLSGQASAQSVNVGSFSSLVQTEGTLNADSLSLSGGANSGEAATVAMTSVSNRIPDLRPAGTFETLAVRGSGSMQVSSSAFQAQNVDLRVSQGDLTLSGPFSPYSQNTGSSILLAAPGNIKIGFDLDNLNFLQRIFYGRNLTSGSNEEGASQSGVPATLNAVSIEIDDLVSSPTAGFLRSLAKDNPSFAGFLFPEYDPQVTESVSSSSIESLSPPSLIPDSPSLANPGSSPGAQPESMSFAGASSYPNEALNLATISDDRLQLLIDLGSFSQYSYFLQAPFFEDAFFHKLKAAGGSSSVFGGSYAVVGAASGSGSASSSDSGDSDSGSDSDGSEDSADAEDDGGGDESGDAGAVAAAKIAAAVPFAPISRPVLSPLANNRLDAALSSEVEAGLQQYVNEPPPVPGPNGAPSSTPNAFIRASKGAVQLYDPARGTFVPAAPGFVVDRPMLFVTGADSALDFSCVGKIAGRVSGNSRVVLAPAEGGTYEANLRSGTMAVLLDPGRPESAPGFAIRTAQGVTSATGTFFAVTEYKGQTYGKVKKGTVKRKATPPGKPDFAAYLSKSKTKPKPPSKN
jgi:filamentous hemagglutinin family protein